MWIAPKSNLSQYVRFPEKKKKSLPVEILEETGEKGGENRERGSGHEGACIK